MPGPKEVGSERYSPLQQFKDRKSTLDRNRFCHRGLLFVDDLAGLKYMYRDLARLKNLRDPL